jgi:MFS family permease
MSRRTATGVAAIDIAVMFMGSTLLSPLYVVYQDAFGFSGTTLTLIYATYIVGNLVALFGFGRISDQLGRRRTLLPAIALAALSTLLFLVATSTPWLFLGRALSGLAIGLAAGAATAWITELSGARRAHASVTATASNFSGLAIGSLLAGLLAQYAPAPLRLGYIVYLAMLVVLAGLVARARETVTTTRALGELSLRPRIGVPREIRARFVSPAATAFAVFALGGFYAALAPTVLRHDLNQTSIAVGGAVVCELFAVAAVTVVATRGLNSRIAMLSGTALLVPSVALLVVAQALQSFPILLIGLAITGVSFALGYRGSLEAIAEIAPDDRRAEVISSYQIVCFTGNALPVVGVGILSTLFGAVTATACLAVVIAALAVLALVRSRSG